MKIKIAFALVLLNMPSIGDFSARAQEQSGSTLEMDFSSKWQLVNVNQRQEEEKFVSLGDRSVTLTAADSPVAYFHVPGLPVSNGTQVEFKFRLKGKGRGQIGFYGYGADKWQQVSQELKVVWPDSAPEEHEFVIPVTGDEIQSIRIAIAVDPDSILEISDLKIGLH